MEAVLVLLVLRLLLLLVLVLRQGKGPWVYAVVHDYVGPSRPTYQLASMETLCLLLMVSVFEHFAHSVPQRPVAQN